MTERKAEDVLREWDALLQGDAQIAVVGDDAARRSRALAMLICVLPELIGVLDSARLLDGGPPASLEALEDKRSDLYHSLVKLDRKLGSEP